MNFIPCYTKDGSIGLYNFEIDDIYHCNQGAYSESVQKFIEPLGDNIFFRPNLRVVDICYGMGYNTLALIQKCFDIRFYGELVIDILEMDIAVFAFSLLAAHKNIDFFLLDFFDFSIFQNKNLLDSIYKILDDENFIEFIPPIIRVFFEKYKRDMYSSVDDNTKISYLHNIYYENVSARYIKNDLNLEKRFKISLLVHIEDARNTIRQLDGKYDFIFLDAFTPLKLPTLWSVEFFKEIYRLLNEDGMLTTYSNSAIIRNGMKEAGFFLGRTKYGTIAHKNFDLNKNPLDKKSIGLLSTKAGIPFYDKDLNATKEEILKKREEMVRNSELLNSSQYLKNYAKMEKLNEK